MMGIRVLGSLDKVGFLPVVSEGASSTVVVVMRGEEVVKYPW